MFYIKYTCEWCTFVWGVLVCEYIHETCVLNVPLKVNTWLLVFVWLLCLCVLFLYVLVNLWWIWTFVAAIKMCILFSPDSFSYSNRNYNVIFSHNCPLCNDQLGTLRLVMRTFKFCFLFILNILLLNMLTFLWDKDQSSFSSATACMIINYFPYSPNFS